MSKDTSTNEKEARPRAAAYIRVSSKKQAEEGVSIAAQIEMAKAYATLKNYSLADDDIFIDDGVRSSTGTCMMRTSGISSQRRWTDCSGMSKTSSRPSMS